MENIVFIGGSPRSGTTLVQNILDSHPDIHGMPEFHHLPEILALHEKMKQSHEKGFIADVCSPGEIDARIRELITSFLLPVQTESPSRWLSEKTPQNCLVFESLIELFPDSKILHVVRDPRAVVSSMLQAGEKMRRAGEKPHWIIANVDNAIFEVRKNVQAGFAAARKHPEHIKTILYEELLENMNEHTRQIAQFLGIEWSERMTRPHEFQHPGEAAMVTEANSMYYDRKRFNQKPDIATAGKWRTNMRAYDQVATTLAFADAEEYRSAGYALDLDHLSAMSRINGQIAFELKRTIRSIKNLIRRIINGSA